MNGEAIKRWRLFRGLTLRELALGSGISKGTLSRLERGQIPNPRIETVERVAEALRLPGSFLYAELSPSRKEGFSGSTAKGVAQRRCRKETDETKEAVQN